VLGHGPVLEEQHPAQLGHLTLLGAPKLTAQALAAPCDIPSFGNVVQVRNARRRGVILVRGCVQDA